MVVVELPERGPTINGHRSHYRVGDTASLNCTSSRSKPAAKLSWHINGVEAEPSQLKTYYPWVHDDGLESRRLGLSFTVDKSHFQKGQLTLKCRAAVEAIYSAVEEEDATVSEREPLILEQREHYIQIQSVATTKTFSPFLLLVLIVLQRNQAIT